MPADNSEVAVTVCVLPLAATEDTTDTYPAARVPVHKVGRNLRDICDIGRAIRLRISQGEHSIARRQHRQPCLSRRQWRKVQRIFHQDRYPVVRRRRRRPAHGRVIQLRLREIRQSPVVERCVVDQNARAGR